MLLFPKIHTHTHTHKHTHTHIAHLTCRHDDLVIQRTSTICRCKPQRLLLHGHQLPVVLACCVLANCQGDIIKAHYGPTQAYCFIHLEASFVCWVLSTLIQVCLCCLVLGISVLAVYGTSSSWVPPRWCRMANFPTYMVCRFQWILSFRVIDWFGMIAKMLGLFFTFFHVLQLICTVNQPFA